MIWNYHHRSVKVKENNDNNNNNYVIDVHIFSLCWRKKNLTKKLREIRKSFKKNHHHHQLFVKNNIKEQLEYVQDVCVWCRSRNITFDDDKKAHRRRKSIFLLITRMPTPRYFFTLSSATKERYTHVEKSCQYIQKIYIFWKKLSNCEFTSSAQSRKNNFRALPTILL